MLQLQTSPIDVVVVVEVVVVEVVVMVITAPGMVVLVVVERHQVWSEAARYLLAVQQGQLMQKVLKLVEHTPSHPLAHPEVNSSQSGEQNTVVVVVVVGMQKANGAKQHVHATLQMGC